MHLNDKNILDPAIDVTNISQERHRSTILKDHQVEQVYGHQAVDQEEQICHQVQ